MKGVFGLGKSATYIAGLVSDEKASAMYGWCRGLCVAAGLFVALTFALLELRQGEWLGALLLGNGMAAFLVLLAGGKGVWTSA